MSLTVSNNSGGGDRKTYEPHAPGTFPAVCCDVFSMETRNPYHGQRSKFTGEVDNRETVTKVCIAFLTTETSEIDGELKPQYTSFWAPLSWHEKSNLRKFVARWLAHAGKQETFDLEQLIGVPALISVDNFTKRDGTTGDGVSNAMALPQGMTAPGIPVDFTRRKDKDKAQEAPQAQAQPKSAFNDDVEVF